MFRVIHQTLSWSTKPSFCIGLHQGVLKIMTLVLREISKRCWIHCSFRKEVVSPEGSSVLSTQKFRDRLEADRSIGVRPVEQRWQIRIDW